MKKNVNIQKNNLNAIGELFTVLANKRSFDRVLQMSAKELLVFILSSLSSSLVSSFEQYSQISLPMVIPSAALFLFKLGLVRTRTPPFDTLSH